MNTSNSQTVGELVANDFRTAAIFEKHGIDFCCKGNTPLTEACAKKNISVDQVIKEIHTLKSSASGETTAYNAWSPSQLIDHIEEKHHRYVTEKIPVILLFLNKLCKVHGGRHPELHEVYQLFLDSAGELTQHMKKEELILFPRIMKLSSASSEINGMTPGMVFSPIEMMMHEHDKEGERFRRISELTNNYQVPSDGCTTYQVAYAMLREFEQDLHLHIHLENNILFPKAILLEKEMIK